MNYFRRAKAWQLFLIFVFAPLLAQPFVILVMSEASTAEQEQLLRMASVLIIFGIYMAWLWTIGHSLYALNNKELSYSTKIFSACVVFVTLVESLFIIYIFPLTLNDPDALASEQYSPIAFIGSLNHIAIIYTCYFVARELIRAEAQPNEEPSFAKIFLAVLLTMFFIFVFVGVWFIQPRVTRVLNEPRGPNQGPPPRRDQKSDDSYSIEM